MFVESEAPARTPSGEVELGRFVTRDLSRPAETHQIAQQHVLPRRMPWGIFRMLSGVAMLLVFEAIALSASTMLSPAELSWTGALASQTGALRWVNFFAFVFALSLLWGGRLYAQAWSNLRQLVLRETWREPGELELFVLETMGLGACFACTVYQWYLYN